MNWTRVLVFVPAVVTASCARSNCVVQNREQASFSQAAVPEEMTIEFCRKGKTPMIESIKTDGGAFLQFSEFLTNDRASRYDGSCSDMESARYNYGPAKVALTSNSFKQVTLCYSDESKVRGGLVPIGSPCPSGTKPQSAPVDDCSQL